MLVRSTVGRPIGVIFSSSWFLKVFNPFMFAFRIIIPNDWFYPIIPESPFTSMEAM